MPITPILGRIKTVVAHLALKGNDMKTDIQNQFNSAFAFFNKTLFSEKLPPCIITISSSGRQNGHYQKKRFICRKSEALDKNNQYKDEIALNPDSFDRDDIVILSTLVHEMVHLWQGTFGEASRAAYHNKQWGDKMEGLGLMPSDTGLEGGKRTGQKMTHYIIYGGQFEERAKTYLNNFLLDYRGQKTIKLSSPKKKSKVKSTCPECDLNAWAKPNTNLICGDCEVPLEPEED